MVNYRKKAVVIEAEQFWPANKPLPFADRQACCFDGEHWYVTTVHGQKTFIVSGDWIIPEPDGKSFYPCKPDIFEARYEASDGPSELELWQTFAAYCRSAALSGESNVQTFEEFKTYRASFGPAAKPA